jgi:hypothetical protein
MEHPILLKQVKKKGNSLIIKLDTPEKKLYQLQDCDIIQIQITGVIRRGSQPNPPETEEFIIDAKKSK